MSDKRTRFAPVELIVAAASITIPLAILFPVFTTIHAQAKHAAWVQSTHSAGISRSLVASSVIDNNR